MAEKSKSGRVPFSSLLNEIRNIEQLFGPIRFDTEDLEGMPDELEGEAWDQVPGLMDLTPENVHQELQRYYAAWDAYEPGSDDLPELDVAVSTVMTFAGDDRDVNQELFTDEEASERLASVVMRWAGLTEEQVEEFWEHEYS